MFENLFDRQDEGELPLVLPAFCREDEGAELAPVISTEVGEGREWAWAPMRESDYKPQP